MSAVVVRDAVGAAVDALTAAGCATPRLDAEVLIADALGVDRGALVADADRPLPAGATREIGERVRRRVAREPVAYILGRRGFRRLELAVDRRVLIPRPETELLVEVALALSEGAWVHDVGTGSGAVALALADERPDLRVTASDVSPKAVAVARANAAALGLAVQIGQAAGLPEPVRAADPPPDLIVANLPYVTDDEWTSLAPEIVGYEPRGALTSGSDGLDAIRALVGQAPAATRLALEHGAEQGEAVRALVRDAETRRDLAGHERVTTGVAPVSAGGLTAESVAAFERTLEEGGVAVFPADTVYGLAADAKQPAAVRRLSELKQRDPAQPSAVMFFSLAAALAGLPELGSRTRVAFELLLPGPLTFVVANPAGRFPLACGSDTGRVGIRVPALTGALEPLTAVSVPVIQSSANLHGGPDPRRLADVPAELRAAADLVLDGGELPGVASTVVDLSGFDVHGSHRVLREGAVSAAALAELLTRVA